MPNASLEADRLPQLRILVVDDDSPVRNACSEIAKGLGYATQSAESVQAARLALANNSVDILLLDLKLPGGGGLALLEDLRAQHPQTIVVIMTAFASVDSAVESMRIGAGDYLTKPFTLEELATTLDRAAQRRAYDVDARLLRERLRASTGLGNLIGNSPAMEKLYRILSKVASTVHPVLIIGESGTGKELVAQSIHTNGPNSSRPFIPVDCGSLLPSMIESELFGHVKGGVNGAARAKTGLLSSAEGATIYLDEIAELPLDLQNRLLRALQEKQVRPIGATQPVPLTARVLASSTRDLPALVESGRFRKDLYFRLNVVNLRIPPLRERKDDIPLLAAHILERLRNEDALPYTFADDAISLLMDYHWPGNVRELEHSIERACALSSGPVLHLGDFPTQMQDFQFHTQQSLQHEASSQATSDGLRNPPASADIGVVHSIADLEKQAILSTIAHLNGDKLTAARLLGIGKTTLYRKLKEYGINDDGSLA
ncbi:MAG: sigma-54-dependent Fis family transcriptional regulator [Acidobacteria bacterium]|nr:sigma-54-dependent Fis family transcriptional regulator [Acidobacteriota bacterium]